MKKGISIWSFAESDLEKCFALAADAGFEGVELALDETGDVNLDSSDEDMKKIKLMAERHGLSLYSVASGLYWTYNYTDPDEAVREKAKAITRKQLQLAAALGCESILVVPGTVTENVPYDVAYERCLEALIELAPAAESCGVQLCIENVWNKFLLSPLEMRGMIDKVASPYVCFYFDVGNVLDFGYPEQWIRVLGDRIKKVHFKDYRTEVGSLAGFVDILSGDVDFKAVMKAFSDIGYEGWATAEMLPPYKQYPEAILYNTSYSMDKIFGRK